MKIEVDRKAEDLRELIKELTLRNDEDITRSNRKFLPV